MIELVSLTKTFHHGHHEIKAVNEISLTVNKGEICIFLGPSGCGKTTTLKMINRLIEPTSGKVIIDGVDTTDVDVVHLRRHIGYVIQQIGLFPNMTIAENIMVVPKLLGWKKPKMLHRAKELMGLVGLDPGRYMNRFPKELSGGQQQRIGVIRALAADPPILLMDEPFGAVDPINRESIQDEFFQLQRELQKTVIMVSHDIDEAIKLGDKVAIFRQGSLTQFDNPDRLLAHPKNSFVADFLGHDRTLKRLLLVLAGEAAVKLAVGSPDIAPSKALELMDEQDSKHLVLVNQQNVAEGYVLRRDIKNPKTPTSQTPQAVKKNFSTTAAPNENLRVLLSKMYQFNTSWLPVIDENGHYQGEVTQDSIAQYLSSGKTI